MQRSLLALVLVSTLFVLTPRAEAQSYTSSDPFAGGAAVGYIVEGVIGATWLGFAIADTVSFALGTPFDEGLSITDLVLGTLLGGAGALCVVWGSFLGDSPRGALEAMGAPMLAIGSYQIGHGVWSLVRLARQRDPSPVPWVSASAGGAMLTWSGAF